MPEDARAVERIAFDRAVVAYDRVRPTYPPALFDAMLHYLRERVDATEARVLEIGAGTGKATAALLEHGARVTAVEIGPEMSAFLRRTFAGQALEVINASFEDAQLEPGAFDLVTSFTAFHWVDPTVRFFKSRDVLRSGGAIGIVSTNQIDSDADRGFFDRVQPVYLQYFPDEDRPDLPGEDVVPEEFRDMESCGLFEGVTLHRYRWDQTYSTADYADLMRSYSGMQVMAGDAREALIAEISTIVDEEYGGSVTRPLVMTLTLGRRQNERP